VPEGGIQIYRQECNWVQALEGYIDTGHTVFLHLGGMQADDAPEGTWTRYALSRRVPTYEVVETDSGVMYGAPVSCTAPAARPSRIRTTGASPTSCSPSGRWCPPACSA
jgi:hypothetical protein